MDMQGMSIIFILDIACTYQLPKFQIGLGKSFKIERAPNGERGTDLVPAKDSSTVKLETMEKDGFDVLC